jgi:UDP-glucose 4-epimerase
MVLVTGGAGYIGSHFLVELLSTDNVALVLDNLSNSSSQSLERVKSITGKDISFVRGDIRDAKLLKQLFSQYPIDSVIHFAGLKSVGESVQKPLNYYNNNVYGSQVLLQAMADAAVFNLVFSSSATVYGEPQEMPISEDCPTGQPANPYGRSKLMVEDILRDLAISDPRWNIGILRYFNPVGAHNSGLIGEDPNEAPNNLMPYITQVAIGKLERLSIFGDDYNTEDGTGVRDYIHVVDLAKGHIAALDYLNKTTGVYTWNLGTGKGYSVLKIIQEFEKSNGVKVPYEIVGRRNGDIDICYSSPEKAKTELGWQAELEIMDMVSSAWKWQSINPNGYE